MARFVDPARTDLIDRLSRSSLSRSSLSTHEPLQQDQNESDGTLKGHSFAVLGSPPIHHSPQSKQNESYLLEEQSKLSVNVWDKRWAGLVVHQACVGIISTCLPLTVYPFLTSYLNMEGTQTLSARMLLAMPWVLKPFSTVFMDCMPVYGGYHRRPFMMLGWLICAAGLFGCFLKDIPEPYFTDYTISGMPLVQLNATQLETLNQQAPSHGAFYVMLMSVATIGYIIADVAADALMLEIAQTFVGGDETNDIFTPAVTAFRYFTMLGSFMFLGIGMSGWHYGGDFDFTLSYNQTMLILAIVAFVPVPMLWFTIAERKRDRKSFRKYLHEIWSLFHNRGVNFVIGCRFFGGIFAGISAVPVNPVALYWARVQPLNDNVVSFVATAFVMWMLNHINKKGWNVNYRIAVIAANVILLALDCGATMFTIWDIVRSQWFWIGLPVMEAVPSGLDYVIFNVILSEIADPGTESLMNSIVTAVAFLSGGFGLTITKYIDAQFSVTNQDLMRDTTHVRWATTGVFLIAYASQLFSLVWLLALPRHASEARDWKKRSGTSTVHAVGLILLLVLCFGWSVAVHVLSVNESTSCYEIFGGRGC